MWMTERRYGAGLIQGARGENKFFGESVIIERLYTDFEQDLKSSMLLKNAQNLRLGLIA